MTIKPTLYWNEKIVMGYLMHAASIHRRLPPVQVQGYGSLWPVTLHDDWERFYDLVNGRTTLGSPMPIEVTYHEEVMEWLLQLDPHRQQIIWMRANQIPWKIMVEEFGQCKVVLWRRLSAGLEEIITSLNRRDLRGEYFRALRSRTYELVKHS